ncbi:MAG: AraC family transcriptional regulator [Inquilinus sp.]|nr:AraC family transcriptional regulator [Inquilinus sp.]
MVEGAEDALSDVLRLIRLNGCVYFQSSFCAPWGMAVDAGTVAQFHMVVRGQGWLRWTGGETLLSSGDVVVFPRGDGHALSDQPDGATMPGRAVLEALQGDGQPFAGGGAATTLLCGHFEFDRNLRHPLIEELPPLIHVRSLDWGQPGWFDAVSSLLVRETGAPGPGAESVVDRLAEVLLIQVMRAHLAERRPTPGFLAALTDRQISRALRVIHRHGDGVLTLASLAQRVGMSRSSLASRFKTVLGEPPMTYLARWRMLKAWDELKSTGRTVADIAETVGYGSEAAFSRAFKRVFDVNPSAVRRSR